METDKDKSVTVSFSGEVLEGYQDCGRIVIERKEE